ncbi:MAG: peptidoglycan-binding protein [Clostridia bacterium]|nr:peptidoglycan-binding protein [Clostridia bacterium]
MSVNNYSLKRDGRKCLSENFKVSEFACKDGSDVVLVDSDLVELLQKIRDHFGRPLIISSGYRTPSHDKAVGGTGKGYHTKGMAADVYIKGVNPCRIAYYADGIAKGMGGIELAPYDGGDYVHIDTRKGVWRALLVRPGNGYETVARLFPEISKGSRGQAVYLLQNILDELGCSCNADGIFGPRTEKSLREFQSNAGIDSDGICGPVTWEKLINNL